MRSLTGFAVGKLRRDGKLTSGTRGLAPRSCDADSVAQRWEFGSDSLLREEAPCNGN